jgi:hypothetical protein
MRKAANKQGFLTNPAGEIDRKCDFALLIPVRDRFAGDCLHHHQLSVFSAVLGTALPRSPVDPSASTARRKPIIGRIRPEGATSETLIILNPWLTPNQRLPGSSPGAPTKQDQAVATLLHLNGPFSLKAQLDPLSVENRV